MVSNVQSLSEGLGFGKQGSCAFMKASDIVLYFLPSLIFLLGL